MTLAQRLSLLWRKFTPLEERLLNTVREVLPVGVQPIFDAQVAAITKVQRLLNWTEISFYRMRSGKADWNGVPMFPRVAEFPLAELRFNALGRRYKATLHCVSGHIFEFTITPGSKIAAFADLEGEVSVQLLSAPLDAKAPRPFEPIPNAWREHLKNHGPSDHNDWKLYDASTAFRTTIGDEEFLVLAERDGDEFILHRIEPINDTLFYLESHDGKPLPLHRELREVLRPNSATN